MRVKTWKVLDGVVDPMPTAVPLTCECGCEAEVPASGRPIAVTGDMGIVFDSATHVLPTKIQCRRCGRVFILEET